MTLHSNLNVREYLERKSTATATTEILKKLNTSIESLPQKCQNILQKVAETQSEMEIEELDPIAISLHHSKEMSDKLEDEYEILKLTQKNAELQAKIDRNSKFIEDFKKELQSSKSSLMSQSVNPNNIEDHMRQIRQKLVSYEESCEKAQDKLKVLAVPDAILPKSLTSLITSLATLEEEASLLKLRADDVVLMQEARDTFNRLRR